MTPFLSENFLLQSEPARELFHLHAKPQPVFDFHNHLSPYEIANNIAYANMTEVWLSSDHYKWRAMRTAGVPEHLITGNATDWEKFRAWVHTLPLCLGNPLYHWSHMELHNLFGLSGKRLTSDNAEAIWHHCNTRLAEPGFGARSLLQQQNVTAIATTDDPTDSLAYHKQLAREDMLERAPQPPHDPGAPRTPHLTMYPTWRPDKVLKLDQPGFPEYLQHLATVSDIDIRTFSDLLNALTRRLEHFQHHGCLSADHGFDRFLFQPGASEAELNRILELGRKQQRLTLHELGQFQTELMLWLGQEYARRGWVMQLHIGAMRNNNQRLFQRLGTDVGADSMHDEPYARPLSRFLNQLDLQEALPKTILYCLNPGANEMLATMAGNFQGDGIPGKIQFGAAWWFNDQKDGMIRQLTQLASMSLLSQSVGMLTDSRSVLSFVRHEYFRRLLCNMVGQWIEDGEAPNDLPALGQIIERICYQNAVDYFTPRSQ
ncbi:glucuronate isomerase [Oleiphilus messinensis]|uniref:Uronate isomerase n=1 Tax=Oleiphilus messinensis TaxID=141451 RepID=A0A1Y0IG27_9GAMM|nr:glucuronate isomerase [Oleiphilus messinensis]ARU59462.1 glucuronate isomerase [Oleiphilus messinensis]